ncbi:alpha-L-fucosidase [Enterococcus gilvus]|uniref:alpha-L-fucosidase n=1 Tax=Enterococcus gilvus TaxID=160453 RepID=UPI0028D72297|nr:alpha-L-fucosidase [Enterococcus gilvus]
MKKIRQDIVENELSNLESYSELTGMQKRKLEWFQDQKIGIIFHWGLYSCAGIVESWQLSKEDTWARKNPWRQDLTTLRNDYWKLANDFHPLNFNATDWAKIVKQSGINYALFTTKHHDGFNMYDTKETEYNVTHYTGKDLFREFAESFRKNNISVGAYYSKADWHSPYYWIPGSEPIGRYASYDPIKEPKLWNRYNTFVTNQLVEICENYGKIDILWLDAGWVNKDNHEYLDMDGIVSRIRQKNPDMLIVDRTIGGEYEEYVTPERRIPEQVPNKVWESNIPLAKNWGFVENDTYKTFSEVLKMILEVVSLGGNIVLGVGPKPDGTLPKESLDIMKSLGQWLALYGEGIYGTRAIPKMKQSGWYFTVKKNILFAFAEIKDFDIEHLNIEKIKPWIIDKKIMGTSNQKNKVLGIKITCSELITKILE